VVPRGRAKASANLARDYTTQKTREREKREREKRENEARRRGEDERKNAYERQCK
jgi:hypothetical protein